MIKKAENTMEKEKQAEEDKKKELSEQVYKESTHERAEDIFSKEDLTCSEVIKIRRWLRQNDKKKNDFKKKVKKGIENYGCSEELVDERTGFSYWVLDRMQKAVKHLKKAGTPLAHYFLALHIKRTENASQALSYLEDLSKTLQKDKNITALRVKLMYELSRISDAEELVDFLEKEYPEDPEPLKARALYLKETGAQQQAVDLFETVLDAEPADEETLFHLGSLLDRFGNDTEALTCMQKAAEIFPVHRNAVLNLGQMYHEIGDTERAVFCFKRVLKQEPDNKIARMQLRDVEATENMYYDEEKAKEREELNKKLQIPVSDFELSVRSRNCLKRMDIKTLGDLIQKTEEDLLSYKNFGETSLAEIKRMLASKDLYLGQAKDMKNKELKEKQQRKIIDVTDSELLKKNVSDLELSVRARKCLDSLDVETFGDLIQYDDNSLLKVRNFGQTSLNEIKQKLASYGLSLANE